MNLKIESILYILIGSVIFFSVFFKVIELPELFMILLSFIGIAAVLNGITNLIYIRYPPEDYTKKES